MSSFKRLAAHICPRMHIDLLTLGLLSPGLPGVGLLIVTCLFAGETRADNPPNPQHLRVPGIQGHDDRQLADSRQPPWSAIGRLNTFNGGFCTATLIDHQRIITAAHCLWNPRTNNWLPACSLHFLLGYGHDKFQQERWQGHYRITGYHLPAQSPPHSPPGLAHIHHETDREGHRRTVIQGPENDWAILDLRQAVPASVPVLRLGEADRKPQAADTRRLVQAGYSRDHPHRLTIHGDCVARVASRPDFHRTLITHQCDVTFGDSGSPLLARDGDSWRIVGINVALVKTGLKRPKAQQRDFGLAIPASAIVSTPLPPRSHVNESRHDGPGC